MKKYLFKITGGSFGSVTGRTYYYKPNRIIEAPEGEFSHLKLGEDYEIISKQPVTRKYNKRKRR